MEAKPLYESLEFRVTTHRVCRSLNLCFEQKDQKKIAKIIKKFYFELTGEKPVLVRNESYKNVSYFLYPVEFIPVMINLINEYKPMDGT